MEPSRRQFVQTSTALLIPSLGHASGESDQQAVAEELVRADHVWVFEVLTGNGKHFIGSVDAKDVNEADKKVRALPKLKDDVALSSRIVRADCGSRCWETQW